MVQADAVAVSQDGICGLLEEIKWVFARACVLKSRFTAGVFTVLFTPSEFGRLFTLRSST